MNQTKFKDLHIVGDKAEKNFLYLSDYVLKQLKPLSGPYALFTHNTECIIRLRDINRILKRLFEGRNLLTQVANKLDLTDMRQWPSGKPFSGKIKKLFDEQQDCTQHMKIDFESLFMFGEIILDQFSILIAYTTGIKCPEKFSFNLLVTRLEKQSLEELEILWLKLSEEMLWLFHNLKRFRNRLVVHRDRPWQTSATGTVYGKEFNLFLPSPPGWLNDKKLDEEIYGLFDVYKKLFPDADKKRFKRTRTSQLLETLFDFIGKIEAKEDRDIISRLFFKKGGSSPSFQVVGNELLGFIEKGSEVLIALAKKNVSAINLGLPHKSRSELQHK